jgi:hypothetical protein
MTRPNEQAERDLNPNRVEDERHARQETEFRLHERGIEGSPADSDEEVADLLEAVERFEAAVEAKGGDLFVNRINSSQPENPAFVPPVRDAGESAADYRRRIDQAAASLRGR